MLILFSSCSSSFFFEYSSCRLFASIRSGKTKNRNMNEKKTKMMKKMKKTRNACSTTSTEGMPMLLCNSFENPSNYSLFFFLFVSHFLWHSFLIIFFSVELQKREREEKKKMMATRISTRDFPFPPYWLPFLHAIFCCLCLSRSLFLSLPSSLVSFAFDSNSYMTNR